jgi:iron complex outermembrane receptor protein
MIGARKAAFLGGASLLLMGSQAWAQAAQPAPSSGATEIGEVVVTGSRIVRDGYTAPTPVTVARAEDLVKTTPSNVPDALNKLPQFANSSSPSRSSHNFANSGANGNVLNLRGLGGSRTLILFDGQRVPPTTFLGTVDVNVIPNLLIERVEIVTGGASAAYGSDAVSGVVNFVLNRKFKGVTGVAQYGASERGDNANYRIGAAAGRDFAEGKGHVLLSGEYYRNKGMLRSDRSYGATSYSFIGSTPGCTNPSVATNPTGCPPGGSLNPYMIGSNVRLTSASEFGKITSGPFANYTFTSTGALTPFDNGTAVGTNGYAIGGSGYNIAADTTAVAPLKTYQTYGRVSYEFTPDISGYVQGSYTRSDLSYVSLANSLVAPTVATLFSGNPYLPAQIQNAFTPASQAITLARYGASSPKPRTTERTDFWEITAGLEGSLGTWKWNGAYNHALATYKVAQNGVWNWQHTFAAIDAVPGPTGAPVCRATLDPNPAIAAMYQGCQPLNLLLTGDAYANQPGYAYAVGTSRYRAENTQDAIAFNMSGPVFQLPAGPVDVAVGVEYRRQKLDLTTNADPALLDTPAERNAYFAGLRGVPASALFYWLTNVGSAHGKETVKEAYSEIEVPLLKDAPFAEDLRLNGAVRVTDYSTSGTVWTWKGGANWKPVHDLMLRATVSRDIRAPNLYELFAGDQAAISLLIDPVSGQTANVPQISGGNPNLRPEKAKTFTVGGVLAPEAIPGFSLAVDYYKVKINGAIGTLSLAQIVNNCAANTAAPECSLITRPSAGAFPTQIRVAPANIAFLQTKGIDFDSSYRRDVGPGTLGLRVYATRLISFQTQQFTGAPVLQYAGVNVVSSTPQGFPKWRGTLTADYSWNDLGVTVSEQYIGKMKLGIPGSPQNFIDGKVDPVWYTDLSVRYDLHPGGRRVQLFGTINNLFDKQPPLIPGTVPGVNLPTNMSLYDVVGRAFTVGARFNF